MPIRKDEIVCPHCEWVNPIEKGQTTVTCGNCHYRLVYGRLSGTWKVIEPADHKTGPSIDLIRTTKKR